MKLNKFFHGFRTLKEMKERPMGFLVDLLLSVIISALIPIPFVGNVIVRYKKMILWGLASIAIIGILILILLITLLFFPYSLFFSPPDTITSKAISSLVNYIEDGFTDTNIPQRNPFGGQGLSYTITTVDFNETEDLIINGAPYHGVEQGIDLVPNNLYFLTNKAAKLTGEPIIFATMTGTTYTYTDPYGALIVEITNTDKTIKTVYIHFQQILVGNHQTVHAGQPIGVMESTGV